MLLCNLVNHVQNMMFSTMVPLYECFDSLDRLAVAYSVPVQLALESTKEFAERAPSQHIEQFLVGHDPHLTDTWDTLDY